MIGRREPDRGVNGLPHSGRHGGRRNFVPPPDLRAKLQCHDRKKQRLHHARANPKLGLRRRPKLRMIP